jgi:predicted RNA-binding protein
MCDTTAFILRNGIEEKLLESVDRVEFDGDNVALSNIFGEEKNLKAKLTLIDTRENKILFEAL